MKEELYAWMSNACDETNEGNVSNDEDDVKQCIVAIYLYLYLRRKDEDGNSSGKSK